MVNSLTCKKAMAMANLTVELQNFKRALQRLNAKKDDALTEITVSESLGWQLFDQAMEVLNIPDAKPFELVVHYPNRPEPTKFYAYEHLGVLVKWPNE